MTRKTPTRTCIACGASGDKRSLIRFVRTPEKQVACDASGKAAGRGAYLCADSQCFATARKKRLFDARLRTKVSEDDYDRLEVEFGAVCDSANEHGREGE